MCSGHISSISLLTSALAGPRKSDTQSGERAAARDGGDGDQMLPGRNCHFFVCLCFNLSVRTKRRIVFVDRVLEVPENVPSPGMFMQRSQSLNTKGCIGYKFEWKKKTLFMQMAALDNLHKKYPARDNSVRSFSSTNRKYNPVLKITAICLHAI